MAVGWEESLYIMLDQEPKLLVWVLWGATALAQIITEEENLDLRFLSSAANRIPIEDHSVDIIISPNVFEHVMEPEKGLQRWIEC